MDNFMDKLAQKINAQEMIKANSAAEAMEMKRLQMQVEEYEKILQEMRIINLKNVELTDSLQSMTKESLAKIKESTREELDLTPLQESMQAELAELKKSVEEIMQKSDEYVHSESVKVYRNVQAVVTEGFQEQSDKLQEAGRRTDKKLSGLFPIAIITAVLIAADVVLHIIQIVEIF